MNDQDWDNICQRCGECCFEKIIDADGTIYHTRIPCRYLDIVSRECKVYHKRFETGEECIRLTPEVVRDAVWLTDGCAYVQWLRKQPAPDNTPTPPRKTNDRTARQR